MYFPYGYIIWVAELMKNKITKDNLVSLFYEEYEARNKKFLLFDIAHANENAHTRLLQELLRYKQNLFLPSFVERLGLPECMDLKYNSIKISTQEKAISEKKTGKGYIDLFISYRGNKGKTINVIIENKIYGAADTSRQLARYVASINGITKENFVEWYSNPDLKNNHIHVVYLTADGTKEPNEGQIDKDFSLPDNIKTALKDCYYPISYSNDILPWLEEDVLPNILYEEDGMMIAGIRQYIAYLKMLLSNEESQVVEDYVNSLDGQNDINKYELLLNAIDKKYIEIPENVIKSLRKELGIKAEAIFSGDVSDEWLLHFTPSFIILYKKAWAKLDTRKYSIPSLYLYAGSTRTFLNEGRLSILQLNVDHLNPKLKEEYKEYECYFGNHDKNIGFKLLSNNVGITCLDVDSKSCRSDFYNNIIATVKPIIDIIDKDVVEELLNSNTPVTPDEILKRVVNSYPK